MNYIHMIETYQPANEQEELEKKVTLDYIKLFHSNVLLRDNEIAHITSSGFIMNPTLDKVLLVHHNIRGVWSWTGGHADGDEDLLYVAVKEAREETGIINLRPLMKQIAAIDILPVYGHTKNSKYVNGHLHLSIAFILIAEETDEVHICAEENSAVEWFRIDQITKEKFSEYDVYLYNKLISRAHQYVKTL